MLRLSAKQVATVRDATRRQNIWDGAVRSGKTVASLVAWLNFVRHAPPGNLLMAGKTTDTIKRNVIDVLTEWLGPRRCRYLVGSRELWLLGRRVYIASANDESSEAKLRGLTLLGAYGDELTTWPESYYRQLLARLSEPRARLFGTTNPDSPNHWLKTGFLDRADVLDLARFHFTLRDNPHLPPEFITSLEAEYTGLWFKRFVLGLWILAEGAIYEAWDTDFHVVPEIPPIQRWWVGIDYGTVNPFVALLMGLGFDGRVYVVSEYRWDSHLTQRQKTDSEYSADLRNWLNEPRRMATITSPIVPDPAYLIVDPSAASFRVQLHSDGVSGVRLADNEVVDGIRLTAAALAQGRLRVHMSCKGLIGEMPGYVWDPDRAEKGIEEPVKLNDHGPDALCYALKTARVLWWNVPLQPAA
jgi:PBSX family phage terminase large subunit